MSLKNKIKLNVPCESYWLTQQLSINQNRCVTGHLMVTKADDDVTDNPTSPPLTLTHRLTLWPGCSSDSITLTSAGARASLPVLLLQAPGRLIETECNINFLINEGR